MLHLHLVLPIFLNLGETIYAHPDTIEVLLYQSWQVLALVMFVKAMYIYIYIYLYMLKR